MSNCRTCSNLMIITEHGEFKRACTERLDTRYEDHDCDKYIAIIVDEEDK